MACKTSYKKVSHHQRLAVHAAEQPARKAQRTAARQQANG